jgi:NADH-quinone oxidoreductase subunit J
MMVGVALVFGLLLEMLYVVTGAGRTPVMAPMHPEAVNVGTVESMGVALFGPFLLPFEVTSLLLLAAIIGAVILAKKNI